MYSNKKVRESCYSRKHLLLADKSLTFFFVHLDTVTISLSLRKTTINSKESINQFVRFSSNIFPYMLDMNVLPLLRFAVVSMVFVPTSVIISAWFQHLYSVMSCITDYQVSFNDTR